MNKKLNSLELAVLKEIAKAHKENYPLIERHIPFLQVKSREFSGVGMYVNFEYMTNTSVIDTHKEHILLSSGKIFIVDKLKFGLAHALNITKGKADFLEFVTYDEELWDGSYKFFKFVEH